MPTRASTPNSASVFKRPSAKLPSVSLLESTPVLFRLPGIEPVQVAAQDVETPASPSSALPGGTPARGPGHSISAECCRIISCRRGNAG